MLRAVHLRPGKSENGRKTKLITTGESRINPQTMNYDKQLFDYIASFGDGWLDHMVVIDNTKDKTAGTFYKVILRGGVSFEIWHEADGSYFFASSWPGEYQVDTSEKVLKLIEIINPGQ